MSDGFMPASFGSNWGNPMATGGYAPPTADQFASWGNPGQTAYGAFNLDAAVPKVSGDGTPDFWSRQGFLGGSYKDDSGAILQQGGWGAPALGVANSLMNTFMGMKQYGLYKDQLSESKRQFGLNYDAQRQTTNTALEDRQRSRVLGNPGAYQSVGAYMAQNGIKGG